MYQKDVILLCYSLPLRDLIKIIKKCLIQAQTGKKILTYEGKMLEVCQLINDLKRSRTYFNDKSFLAAMSSSRSDVVTQFVRLFVRPLFFLLMSLEFYLVLKSFNGDSRKF